MGTDRIRTHVGQRVGKVGLPLPGTSFKIVDPESFDELPTNDQGMGLIAGPQVMNGYLDDRVKSKFNIK